MQARVLEGVAAGELTVSAEVLYLRLVSSVAEYLNVPEDPDGAVVMSAATATKPALRLRGVCRWLEKKASVATPYPIASALRWFR